MRQYTTITKAKDVTEEILNAAEMIHDGWFLHATKIDWDDFLNRLDGLELSNGTRADLGGYTLSPAIKAIKKHIREYRKL